MEELWTRMSDYTVELNLPAFYSPPFFSLPLLLLPLTFDGGGCVISVAQRTLPPSLQASYDRGRGAEVGHVVSATDTLQLHRKQTPLGTPELPGGAQVFMGDTVI